MVDFGEAPYLRAAWPGCTCPDCERAREARPARLNANALPNMPTPEALTITATGREMAKAAVRSAVEKMAKGEAQFGVDPGYLERLTNGGKALAKSMYTNMEKGITARPDRVVLLIGAPYSYNVVKPKLSDNGWYFGEDLGCTAFSGVNEVRFGRVSGTEPPESRYYCCAQGFYIFSPQDAGVEVTIDFVLLKKPPPGQPKVVQGITIAGSVYDVGDLITVSLPGEPPTTATVQSINADRTVTFKTSNAEFSVAFDTLAREVSQGRSDKLDLDSLVDSRNPFRGSPKKWIGPAVAPDGGDIGDEDDDYEVGLDLSATKVETPVENIIEAPTRKIRLE